MKGINFLPKYTVYLFLHLENCGPGNESKNGQSPCRLITEYSDTSANE